MLPESLRTALGTVIAQCRREWRRDKEVIGAEAREAIAQSREVVAEFRARIAELDASFREQIAARLAVVRDGVDGTNGRDGTNGKDGRDGLDGADGKDAAPARDGKDGRDGVDGKDGRDGVDGAPGKLPACAAWAPGVHYEAEVLTHDGATWQAARDTAAAPGVDDDWVQLAAAGRDGATPRFVGTYAADAAYRQHDVVALNGGSFAALRDAPSLCPGADWQLIVGRGKAGRDGKDGRDGEPGPRIKSWAVDLDAFVATPILADGQRGASLDLRGLFERFRDEMEV